MPASDPPQSLFCFHMLAADKVAFPEHFPSFLYEKALPDPLQCAHLKQFGQIQPVPVLQSAADRYQLLGAYGLFTAIKAAGGREVLCQILPRSLPPSQRFPLQALLNLQALQVSPVLRACLLQEARLSLSEEDTLALLPLMGEKGQPYVLRELLSLLELSPAALLALHKGGLTRKASRRLVDFSWEEQELLVHLITTYQIGGSKQQNLIEMLGELRKRHQKPIQAWIGRDLTEEEGHVGRENAPQHLHKLMQSLQEQCFPSLMQAEKDFHAFVRKTHLPAGASLAHSPSFENPGLELCLEFPDTETFLLHWEAIRNAYCPGRGAAPQD